MNRRIAIALILLFIVCGNFFLGCSNPFHQPGSDVTQVYSKIFLTDYNTAWQAVLESIKSYDRTVVNRQGGILQTSWLDNTAQKNFVDPFGESSTYIKSRFRLNITVAPGQFAGKEGTKITIQKEQLIQRDLLEGWKEVSSDAVEEKTILYRVGRIVAIKHKLKKLEEMKTKKALDDVSF